MVILHHLNQSRSQRILWMLEELAVPYEVKSYQRNQKTMLAPEELRQVHALGKSPVITDGDITVAESGAIIEYLIQTYQTDFKPSDASALREYNYWMHYAEGSLMPPLVMKLVFDKVKTSPMPFFVKPIAKAIANKVMDSFVAPNIKSNLDFVEQHLSSHRWFCGDQLSGADIQMSFPLEAVMSNADVAVNYPNISDFVKRCHARTAYQQALSVGGPYDYA